MEETSSFRNIIVSGDLHLPSEQDLVTFLTVLKECFDSRHFPPSDSGALGFLSAPAALTEAGSC